MKNSYAKTLANIAAKDEKAGLKAVKELIASLKSRGEMKLLPEILRDLKVIMARRAKLAPVVEVARKEDAHSALAAAAKAGIKAEHAVVNHSLIRGWRAREGGILVDHSAKRALVDIYRNITNG